jgi:hypothetical protein
MLFCYLTLSLSIVTPFDKMPWGYTVSSVLVALGALCLVSYRASLSSRTAADCSVIIIRLRDDHRSDGSPAKEFQSRAAKAIWDLNGIYATSRHVPGVRFAGVSHPGLIGTAPSAELLTTWNKREGELISACGEVTPAVAFPPLEQGAYVGQDLPEDVRAKIAKEGARTIPGREHGGNCDV